MQSSFKEHFQFIVFRQWKLEKSYTKKYWCHHGLRQRSFWDQHPKAGQQSRRFQSNKPTLNQFRERSGRPDITHAVIGVQDERKTSRSQEIDVNSSRPEPSSSERTVRPITGTPVHETSVIQTRSSEDKKDFNVEQAHERTGWLVFTHDAHNVSDSSQRRFVHDSETLNVGDDWWSWRESWVNNGERDGHGLPHSRTTTFFCEARTKCQRSRIDSENWEPPKSTFSSTRSTKKPII